MRLYDTDPVVRATIQIIEHPRGTTVCYGHVDLLVQWTSGMTIVQPVYGSKLACDGDIKGMTHTVKLIVIIKLTFISCNLSCQSDIPGHQQVP